MTTLSPTRPASAARQAAVTPARGATFRWSWRLVRRGTLLMWLAIATYMAVEVLSYRAAYPDQASREKLLELSSSTVVRTLQGAPGAIDTVGGFAVWDGGWMISLIVACWAVLTTTRLTRGEEDTGRIDLVLSRRVGPRGALAATFTAMGVAVAGIGVAAAAPLVAFGQPVAGSVLWGAGLAGFGVVMVTLAALCAQLVEPRRRVAAVAFGLVAVGFLLRAFANSSDGRIWLLAFTPFGWLDRLSAFTDDHWLRLAYPGVATVVLGYAALLLSTGRDTGSALRPTRGTRHSRLRLLGGAGAFGWRLGTGALVAWLATVAVSGVVFGLMVGPIVDFIAEDETYRKMLESMGMDMSSPAVGFLSYTAVFMALPFAAFVGWRLGAARQEEADGRLDNLLVRGVVRWRWLTTTAVLAYAAAVLVVAACTVSLFAGAVLVDGGVTLRQVVEPMAGTLPLVALFTGLAVLAFALAPRLTVVLPVTAAVLGYLLETFGSMLEWPPSVLGLSPFHHLARLPQTPMTPTAVVVMTAIGVVAAVIGVAAFSRRDLRGS